MLPLIGFIVLVIDLYIWVIIAGAILSWLIAFNVVNTQNRFVYSVGDMLYRVTEPALRPIRSILPNLGGIDISPVILILLLLFLRDVVLIGWLAPAFAGPDNSWAAIGRPLLSRADVTAESFSPFG